MCSYRCCFIPGVPACRVRVTDDVAVPPAVEDFSVDVFLAVPTVVRVSDVLPCCFCLLQVLLASLMLIQKKS